MARKMPKNRKMVERNQTNGSDFQINGNSKKVIHRLSTGFADKKEPIFYVKGSFVGTLGEWLARQKDGVRRRPQAPPCFAYIVHPWNDF
jgi:hypothetical protein